MCFPNGAFIKFSVKRLISISIITPMFTVANTSAYGSHYKSEEMICLGLIAQIHICLLASRVHFIRGYDKPGETQGYYNAVNYPSDSRWLIRVKLHSNAREQNKVPIKITVYY